MQRQTQVFRSLHGTTVPFPLLPLICGSVRLTFRGLRSAICANSLPQLPAGFPCSSQLKPRPSEIQASTVPILPKPWPPVGGYQITFLLEGPLFRWHIRGRESNSTRIAFPTTPAPPCNLKHVFSRKNGQWSFLPSSGNRF